MQDPAPKHLGVYVHFKVSEERVSPDSHLNLICEVHCEGASPSAVTAEGAEAPWLDQSL